MSNEQPDMKNEDKTTVDQPEKNLKRNPLYEPPFSPYSNGVFSFLKNILDGILGFVRKILKWFFIVLIAILVAIFLIIEWIKPPIIDALKIETIKSCADVMKKEKNYYPKHEFSIDNFSYESIARDLFINDCRKLMEKESKVLTDNSSFPKPNKLSVPGTSWQKYKWGVNKCSVYSSEGSNIQYKIKNAVSKTLDKDQNSFKIVFNGCTFSVDSTDASFRDTVICVTGIVSEDNLNNDIKYLENLNLEDLNFKEITWVGIKMLVPAWTESENNNCKILDTKRLD